MQLLLKPLRWIGQRDNSQIKRIKKLITKCQWRHLPWFSCPNPILSFKARHFHFCDPYMLLFYYTLSYIVLYSQKHILFSNQATNALVYKHAIFLLYVAEGLAWCCIHSSHFNHVTLIYIDCLAWGTTSTCLMKKDLTVCFFLYLFIQTYR